jgi:hypothetical protein
VTPVNEPLIHMVLPEEVTVVPEKEVAPVMVIELEGENTIGAVTVTLENVATFVTVNELTPSVF